MADCLLVTDVQTRTTFTIEPARKGSAKLLATAMPADVPVPDVRVAFRSVPLYIRRAARAALNGGRT